MFENTEFPIPKRKLDSIFKVLVHILKTPDGFHPHVLFIVTAYVCFLLVGALSLYRLSINHLNRQAKLFQLS